jgi:integrase
VWVELRRPHLRIRNGAAKGGRPRTVPLWWDAGTLADLAGWKQDRLGQGTGGKEAFVASQRPGRAAGMPLSRHTLRKRFRTACKVLGRGRLASLTIHHGRHTFISHALAGGRTLAEVRDAAARDRKVLDGLVGAAVAGSADGAVRLLHGCLPSQLASWNSGNRMKSPRRR